MRFRQYNALKKVYLFLLFFCKLINRDRLMIVTNIAGKYTCKGVFLKNGMGIFSPPFCQI